MRRRTLPQGTQRDRLRTESTIVPEWRRGYLDAFKPSVRLQAALEWGSSGRHQSTISHRHISRMGRMLMPERAPPKRDATGPWRLSGYCGYGRYSFPVLPENFPFASLTGIWAQASDLSDDFREAQRFEARNWKLSRFMGMCPLIRVQ
jgi:hypothetical protein